MRAEGVALDALPWVIVGGGRVGRMMALVARAQGRRVAAVWNRSAASSAQTGALLPEVERLVSGPLDEGAAARLLDGLGPVVCWVTVVDDAIAEAARAVAPLLCEGSAALHMAGSMGSRVLREAGVVVPVGSLHPLQAITDPERALASMREVTWTLEGDAPVVALARAVMAAQGVEPLAIDGDARALYHASAVCAANLLVSLIDAAYAMAAAAGIEQEQARQMLLPLTQSCLDNLRQQSPAEALTGPAARGDMGTITRHLDALAQHPDPQLRPIYALLTERALGLVRER